MEENAMQAQENPLSINEIHAQIDNYVGQVTELQSQIARMEKVIMSFIQLERTLAEYHEAT